MSYADYDIRFLVENGVLTVKEIAEAGSVPLKKIK